MGSQKWNVPGAAQLKQINLYAEWQFLRASRTKNKKFKKQTKRVRNRYRGSPLEMKKKVEMAQSLAKSVLKSSKNSY